MQANSVGTGPALTADAGEGDASAPLLDGRFQVRGALAAGGQGETLRAWDLREGSPCVIKFAPRLDTGLGREFEVLRRLCHPNIVRVRAFGTAVRIPSPTPGAPLTPYLVLDAIEGQSLADGPAAGISPPRLWELATALTDALGYLHERGVLHGDVTPFNVLVERTTGRVVLVDFGLCGSPKSPGHARPGLASGTPGFAAPEALLGAATARSDLFGLGATLWWCLGRQAPYGEGGEGVARLFARQPPRSLAPAGEPLAQALQDLSRQLIAFAPDERPASARDVSARLARIAQAHGFGAPGPEGLSAPPPFRGDRLAGLFTGRARELDALARVFDDLLAGQCPRTAVIVSGPEGSGRRSLLGEALQRARRAALVQGKPALRVLTPEEVLREAGAGPRLAGAPADQTYAWFRAQVLSASARVAEVAPLVVWVDPAADAVLGGADLSSWRGLLAAQEPGRVLFVGPGPPGAVAEASGEVVLELALSPLRAEDLAALCAEAGLAPGPSEQRRLLERSGGNAALLTHLLRQTGEGTSLAGADEAPPEEILRGSFARLSDEAQAAVLEAWWELPAAGVPTNRLGGPGRDEASRAGWLVQDDFGSWRLPSGLHHSAVWGASQPPPGPRVAALAAKARQEARDVKRAEALRLLGAPSEAREVFFAAAGAQAERGAVAEALWCWERARALPEPWPSEAATGYAEALGAVGRYEDAAAWLEAQPEPALPAGRARRAEVHAALLRRRGTLHAALTRLERTRDALSTPDGADARARLGVQMGRLLIAQGRFSEAWEAVVAPVPDAARGLWLETRALAASYLGRAAEAEEALLAWAHLARERNDTPLAARCAAVEGLHAQLLGQPRRAAEAYLRAYEAHVRTGDVHGGANARLNLAMANAELGFFTVALEAFRDAHAQLLRLGADRDATLAVFNAGLLFARLGDQRAAEAAWNRVHGVAVPGDPAVTAWAEWLSAERALARGAFTDAASAWARASASFAKTGDPHQATLASWRRVDALAQSSRHAEAYEESQKLAVPSAGAEVVALARCRLALADPSSSAALVPEARRLASLADTQSRQGRTPAAFRSAVVAARALLQAGRGAAAHALARQARHSLEELVMNTPPEYQAALDADADARWLATFSTEPSPPSPRGSPGPEVTAQRLAEAQARLRRFVRLSKRLNGELRLPRLLETVLDTVIELTEAERGFLLLRDPQGQLTVRAARNIDQSSLLGESLAFSRSIADQVAASGSPVVTVDAAHDDRFRQALSVSDLQLRSVVAVPLTIKGVVEGTIYVDNRLRQGVFDEEAVNTLLDFAELAALAVGNARLVQELRRRDRLIEGLNRRLTAELAVRKEELSSMRVELNETREDFVLRYEYGNIVGRSVPMMSVLKLLDRVSDTQLPVLIQGESGTGKELVARALAANGSRKDQPFVSENCAAIPETLLESTLFGYVRGAFTGAERDTRGLFAIANGGTLFLDEVGEMSPALQGKLLRVLQEGEYRRVGGQKTETTDVRLVVATNRDLQTLVKEGRFRQDLYFRLAVVRVDLPPLRARGEDVPLLVRHFLSRLQKQAGVRARQISAEALSRLCAYSWPGNIRELENEIARASAFADETIGVSDLSPHVAASALVASAAPSFDVDDLKLKPRVEQLEKGLLRDALDKCGGNQTRAAAALGLSRFGLQKKLKRYGLETA
ncbi:MAG: sigma 54-interacting transcriptional regulator [Myxococcales bacterium]|nr:sigma 54-interacting transcriptional regulator [Myxococcales bacterium]